jgi:hypothetical protein
MAILSQGGSSTDLGIITQYSIDTYYDWDLGLVKLPTAAPDGAAASIVKTHAQTGRKFVIWTCEREIGRPVLPHWDTQSTNEVLVFKRIVDAEPFENVDGNPVWRVSGIYVYELYNFIDIDNGGQLINGFMPYDPWQTQTYIDGRLFDKRFLAVIQRSGGSPLQKSLAGPPNPNPVLQSH